MKLGVEPSDSNGHGQKKAMAMAMRIFLWKTMRFRLDSFSEE
jgi:hypothetical protein